MASKTALPTMKADRKAEISSYLDKTAHSGDFPAIFAGVTNAKETLFVDQAGDRWFGQPELGKVTEETPTEMYSQTKLVTSVAVMQLVEQGLVNLDSTDDIEKWLPELGTLPVLEGYKEDDTPILRQPKNKVTLRMLLTHTAGCTYGHSDARVQTYLKQNPVPGIVADNTSLQTLMIPFVFEPGTSFEYSHSIDWAGVLLERITKLNLEQYFQKHIFEPCGITSMTFYPAADLADRKMGVCQRDAEGKLSLLPGGFGFGRPRDPEVVKKVELLSGGAGLFGTQADYLRFLRGLLRSDPKYGADEPGLLKPESYAELFKPSIPKDTDGTAKLAQMVARARWFDPPVPSAGDVNHSVGMVLNTQDFAGRRKALTGCWSGAAKTQFWIDPTTGIAAVFGTQLFSAVPGDIWGLEYAKFESLVYGGLE